MEKRFKAIWIVFFGVILAMALMTYCLTIPN